MRSWSWASAGSTYLKTTPISVSGRGLANLYFLFFSPYFFSCGCENVIPHKRMWYFKSSNFLSHAITFIKTHHSIAYNLGWLIQILLLIQVLLLVFDSQSTLAYSDALLFSQLYDVPLKIPAQNPSTITRSVINFSYYILGNYNLLHLW